MKNFRSAAHNIMRTHHKNKLRNLYYWCMKIHFRIDIVDEQKKKRKEKEKQIVYYEM